MSVAEETAYYLNAQIPAVALIAEGVRFPAGQWLWIANATALAWLVDEMVGELFPALQSKAITFATLTSDFDVMEFERSVRKPWAL